jgi:RHS repeat-associated protein
MRPLMIALVSGLLAFAFSTPVSNVPLALADPSPSGAEQVQLANPDFSGVGLGDVGTPPPNYDFETASSDVGTPPANNDFASGDFTSWEVTGTPTVQSGGPGGYYAQLASSQKIKSSAFTVDSSAQVLNINVAAVASGTFQWKFNIYSGAGYSTKTVKTITTCPSTCTNWSGYSIDVIPWVGQSIKVEIERYLGDLKTDDVAVGHEVLDAWTPIAGDKISRLTGGPGGAYAKTTTTLTSSAFTLSSDAQNATIDLKIDSASGSYDVHVLSGTGYSTQTQVLYSPQADNSTWLTRTFGVGDWSDQSIKLKVVPAANTTVFVDLAGKARHEIPAWKTSSTTPITVSTESGLRYLSNYTEASTKDGITLDYQGYSGTLRVNWFAILFRMTSNLNCQANDIGSTLKVHFGNHVSQDWGTTTVTDPASATWTLRYFYVRNPNSPNTPSPETGTFRVVGWPTAAPFYACENARRWKPPDVVGPFRVDGPGIETNDYCGTGGVLPEDLCSKPTSTSTKDPVDVTSGNFIHAQTDLAIPGRGPSLRFTRSYSAQGTNDYTGGIGPLGAKWSHNWQASLAEFDSTHAHIRLPGGASQVWTKISGAFVPPAGVEGTLVKNGDNTWTLTSRHKLVYTFNSAGRLTSVKDRNLNTVSLSYDGSNRLSTITAPGSRTLTLTYNGDNRISSVADSASRSVSYGYNSSGDLTSVTFGSSVTEYQYANHLLTQGEDANNHLFVRNTYDTRNRVSQQLDALGGSTTLAYSTPGAGATRVTDQNSRQTTHYFDTSMRITHVMDHNGGVTTRTYGSDNDLTSVQNPLSKTWSYTHDSSGNVLTHTNPLRQASGTAESGTNCGTLDTGNGTDDDGDTKVDDGCPLIKATYTANNDPDLVTDPLGRQTDYIYDTTGNLTRVARKVGTDVKALTCFGYNSDGLVTSSVQSTNLTIPSGATDPCTGNKTILEYDSAGRANCVVNARFSASHTCASGSGKKLTVIYDSAGRVTYSTNELTNNVRPVVGAAPETGPAQCGSAGTGNGSDNDSDSTADDGCPSSSFTYDSRGSLLSSKDGLGNTLSFEYDLKGYLTKITESNRQPVSTAESGSSCGTLGTGNDADNDGDTVKDDGCPSTIYSYDIGDRLIEVVDALGNRTSYGYDGAGNRTSVTSGRASVRPVGANGPETFAQCGSTGFGNGVNEDSAADDSTADDGCPSTSFAFDSLHRLQSMTDALGRVTAYQYDAGSNVTKRVDANHAAVGSAETGSQCGSSGTGNGTDEDSDTVADDGCPNTLYTYDDANRLEKIEHWNGATLADSVDPTLDIVGNRTQMVDSVGTTKYAYDFLNRLTCFGPNTISGSCPSGNVGYNFDDASGGSSADYPGQRTKITYADGKYVDYTYESDGRMKTVTDWLSRQTEYTYYDDGLLKKTQQPNGFYADYVYDSAGRLTDLDNKTPQNGIWSGFTYSLDANGNRTQDVDDVGTTTYEYDALNRLTNESNWDPGGASYAYDANGNRLTKGSTNYTNDAANQMTAVGSTTYQFDKNGNQTQRGSDTFSYDHENRLTQTVIGGSTFSSTYNGDGLRMSHTSGGTTTNYTWDVGAGLAEILKDNTYTYVYGLDLISATDSSGNQNYYMHNGLGSVTNILDYNGNEKGNYFYDAFGLPRFTYEVTANDRRFTGEQRDSDSSLYYLRARYYDPATGRFLGQDPLMGSTGNPQLQNRYAYVNNNPVNAVDPSGLWPDCKTPWDCADDFIECAKEGCLGKELCGKEGAVACAETANDWLNEQIPIENFLTWNCLDAALSVVGFALTYSNPAGLAAFAAYQFGAGSFVVSSGVNLGQIDKSQGWSLDNILNGAGSGAAFSSFLADQAAHGSHIYPWLQTGSRRIAGVSTAISVIQCGVDVFGG